MAGKRYKPRRIKARQVGKESCEMVGPLKLCIVAKRYGYAAKLYSRNGKQFLPVPTKGRTMKAARSAARQFLRRVKMSTRQVSR